MKYLIFFITIFYVKISSQNTTVDIFKPIPTVSYLSTYIDTPVDISTGVPKVDLPGFSLPTKNKNVNINVSMSYHSKNAVRFQQSSDVGLGWSMMNVNNVISKTVIGGPDEAAANNPLMNMEYFQFNDVFYFNAFGMSGKFVFRKANNTNVITVQNLGTSKEKIEFTNSTTKYFDILNFKITDEFGNQYFFDKTGKALSHSYNYKGAYYLSKVLDAQNQEIITVEYAEYHYNEMPNIIFTDYKPKKIISKGYGEINLEYDYYPQNRYKSNSTHMSDCYLVKKLELKDQENRLLQQIDLTYGGLTYYKYFYGGNVAYDTTVLDKITRKNNQGNEIEAYSFAYNSTGTEREYGPSPNFGFDVCTSDPEPVREWTDNPKYSTIGTLSKMILPTKGYVKFNFESSQYYVNRTSVTQSPLTGSTISYEHDKETQYYKLITSSNFDTKINSTFTFNVTPGSANTPDHRNLVFCFQVIGYDPSPLLDPEAIPVIALYYDNQNIPHEADAYGRMYIPVGLPGPHTVTVGGNTTGVGNFSVFELTDINVSNHNYKSKYGARIKSIEYFDSESAVLPSNYKIYHYERFSDNETSSGTLSPFISLSKRSDYITMYGDTELNKNIIYKNVKEVNADGGYSKYTFIGPDNWITNYTSSMNYLEDLNNRGLLLSKEVYSSTNQKVASENHEYTYDNLNINPFIIEDIYGYTTLIPIYVKKHKITSTAFFPQNRSVTSSSEKLVNKNDFNVEYTKEASDQGDITETYYDYPYSKQISKLLNKNMYKNLIETRTLFNGEVVSKTESKYDEPSHLFPTSVLSKNLLTGSMTTQITYDQYDVNGNVMQYTTKDGIPTAVIWGYNGTLPIAKITGATYAQVSSLATAIVAASNADALAVTNNDETAFLNALDNFRNQPGLSAFQIATYTYDPLTGVRSLTPPSGIREIYLYDSAGRLQKIVDEQGKILKENTYNYKP
ncbi:hypothetical protein PGH12_04745 [Chryseobacterium wangxinyae]|uniref:hypothetical protein n=1 Tax=Chryseobacterium sp. CY350 TaxID=2997336 RepID=UPI00227032F4|nr:hypothetical protein [Chryseobacterium sp. CY350]MCY0976454.1 hypothetical protein [Chryseobacterium sp. CY350]WBZ96458.1 hypothetical protein PGH12_04745 [Chryseobacterium sp. CY350]